jgi:hypothetical protein
MPIFALDANRLPIGRTAIYWYDFVGKNTFEQEVKRLKETQIASMLEMQLPSVLNQHAVLFDRHIFEGRKHFAMLIEEYNEKNKSNFKKTLGISVAICN